jgi:hypothetical protein
MSDKSFKVKTGLQIPSVTSANILSTDASGNISSTSTLPITDAATTNATVKINEVLI